MPAQDHRDDDSGDEVISAPATKDDATADDEPPAPRSRWRRRFKRLVITASAFALVALLGLITTNVMVTSAAEGLAFDDPAAVPVRPVAIVFGAGVVNGVPSPALADRVHGAVLLYQQGRVSHLLMTGDNSRVAYDEVTAMRQQAMDEGVPSAAITRDFAGFNTYDSCYRARDVFGVRAAVLVTQHYHLPRALYSCRELGIDAVGLIIPDWQHRPEALTRGQYPKLQSNYYMFREWFARSKAVVGANVTHPEPKVLGPYEGLRETQPGE